MGRPREIKYKGGTILFRNIEPAEVDEALKKFIVGDKEEVASTSPAQEGLAGFTTVGMRLNGKEWEVAVLKFDSEGNCNVATLRKCGDLKAEATHNFKVLADENNFV